MKKYQRYLPWLLPLLLFCDAASLADLNYSTTEKNCQLTANPDECLRKAAAQTGTPVNLNNYALTSDTLGLSGPWSFTLRYDQDLALVFGAGYTQMFNEVFGVSGKFTLGQNERRANLTSGFAVTKDQQVKLTYEYLAQNQNFDFASGAVQQWVDQHAVGGAYQYLLRHEIVHSLELSASTIRANSKDLSSLAFNQVSTTNSTNYDVNYRHIAGGTENTVQAALNLLPLKNTALTVGAGYSAISYDMQYQASPSNSGLAYKLELTHVLTPKAKIGTSVNNTASGREHNVQISHILPKNIEVGVKAQYVAGAAGLSDSKNIALNFSYPAPKQYSLSLETNMQELHNWVEKPVVYATRVLAIKDEKVQSYSFSAGSGNPEDQVKSNNSTDVTEREINPVLTQDYFQFTDPALTVSYSAAVTCPVTQPQNKCNLQDLGIHLVANGNQATLSSFALIPESTGVGNYVITITGNGTRAGLTPVTANVHFNLNITTSSTQWATTAGTLAFDSAPVINQALGKSACTGGILLQLKDANNNLENPQTVGWATGKPDYWTVQQDGQQWCLMRDTSNSNLSGNLNAADVDNTANLNLCAYEAGNSSCISGTIAATVTGDSSTDGAGANVIGAQITDPYDVKAGDSFNNWDATTTNGLASYYKLPAGTVAIVGDSYSDWSNAQIPGADPATWPSISISPEGVMSGRAPTVTGAYQGRFTVKSLKAAANNNVTASFQALVGGNDPPDIHSISGTMRYSFTSNNNPAANNSGLGMQSGDQLIDLNSMVSNASNPTFTFIDSTQKMPSWQIVQGNPAWEGDPNHWYLFRDLASSNHLDAADVNTSQQIFICVTANGYSPNCSQKVTVQVTPETNASYATVAINDSTANPSFTYVGGSDVATSSNPAPNALSKTISQFVGGQLAGDAVITIDNDVRSVINPPVMATSGTPTWSNYVIAAGTLPDGGALAGVAPIVASDSVYTSTFTAHSVAKGADVPTVQFHSKVMLTSPWVNTTGAIKFDTLAVDPSDQINLNNKVNPAMTITSFDLGSSVAGNYNPANWQVLADNSGGTTTYYLTRKASGTDIDATEVSSVVQVPISVTGTLSGSTVTTNAVLNITVNPDTNVFYQYTGNGTAGSPVSSITVAAQYTPNSDNNNADEVPNTRVVFSSSNVQTQVALTTSEGTTTYNVNNDSAMTYNFPAPPRTYIDYPGNNTIKFTYAPSIDLGDALSLVQSSNSANIQANSKAHGTNTWGAMQGLNVQVNDLSVTTLPAAVANNNIQCSSVGPVSTQRSIYYVTVPLNSGRIYYVKGSPNNLLTSTPGGKNITRTVCPGNPGTGTDYFTAQGNNIDASDSQYDCRSEVGRDGAAYVSPTTATTQLPAVRASGAGANLLTFFVTETNVGCTTTGGGFYPEINSPIMLTISSTP